MKKLMNKEFLSSALKVCVCAALLLITAQVIYHILPSMSWCDDLFGKTETVLGDTKQKLVNVALALFPVCLIIIVLTLFFTKDERKIGIVVKAGVVVCLALVIILLINAGVVKDTLMDWFGVTESGTASINVIKDTFLA